MTLTGRAGCCGRLAAENIEVEILRIDFLVSAVGAQRLDRVVEVVAQLGVGLAYREAGTRTVARVVVLVAADELEVLARVGFQETVIRGDRIGELGVDAADGEAGGVKMSISLA